MPDEVKEVKKAAGDSGAAETPKVLPKMGPLAVLVNPLVPTKDKFLVFSSSAQRTVTIEHWGLDGATGVKISPSVDDKFEELLGYPSSLTAVLLEDTVGIPPPPLLLRPTMQSLTWPRSAPLALSETRAITR